MIDPQTIILDAVGIGGLIYTVWRNRSTDNAAALGKLDTKIEGLREQTAQHTLAEIKELRTEITPILAKLTEITQENRERIIRMEVKAELTG